MRGENTMNILINSFIFLMLFLLGRTRRIKNEFDIFHVIVVAYIYSYIIYPIFLYEKYKSIMLQHINICLPLYIVFGILCFIDTIVIKRKLKRE